MRFLSIDIGIRNFAYCVVDIHNASSQTIIQWEKIDILKENGSKIKHAKSVPLSKLYRMVHDTLMRRHYQWIQQKIDLILIENQIGKSKNAKMEGMISMWFYIHFQKVEGVSPSWKFELQYLNKSFQLVPALHVSQSYHRRKFDLVDLISKWIRTQPIHIQSFFNRFKGRIKTESKQDDLADSFAQAVAWYLHKYGT
jgi:hypothetical protein